MPVVEVNNVWKTYLNGKRDAATIILKNINLNIEENEFVCIVGSSGCGKTTLLNIIAGFEKPQRGEVYYRGDKVEGPSSDRAVIFQEYSLLPWMDVLKNVAFSVNRKRYNKNERLEIAREYLELVGLSDYADYRPNDLSGGMKQRVAIARTLAMEPDVLLMDEPFSSLDAQTRRFLDRKILDIWNKKKRTVIFITHNIDEAIMMSTRIIMLSTGPGTVIGEWRLPEGERDVSSKWASDLRMDILSKLQMCSCTSGNIITSEKIEG